MSRDEMIEHIVGKEWNFFQEVENEGGRASCQEDPETFFIMRRSQFSAWPEELLASYEADLARAREEGRNPLAEKYAWMMESTCPERFEKLRRLLPPLSPRACRLIDEAAAIQTDWMSIYRSAYPALASGHRVLYASEDTSEETSFETYLRGELKTYSEQTLERYLSFLHSLREKGENLTYRIMACTLRAYGYASLEDAEMRLSGT